MFGPIFCPDACCGGNAGIYDYYAWWHFADIGFPYSTHNYREGHAGIQSSGLYRVASVQDLDRESWGDDGDIPAVPWTTHRPEEGWAGWFIPVAADPTKHIASIAISSSPMGLPRDPNQCQADPPLNTDPQWEEYCWLVRKDNLDHAEVTLTSKISGTLSGWSFEEAYEYDVIENKLSITQASVNLAVDYVSKTLSVTEGVGYVLDIHAAPSGDDEPPGLIVEISNTADGADYMGCELYRGTVANQADSALLYFPAAIVEVGFQKYVYRAFFTAASTGSCTIKIGLSGAPLDPSGAGQSYAGEVGDFAYIYDVSVSEMDRPDGAGSDVVLFDCVGREAIGHTYLLTAAYLVTSSTTDLLDYLDDQYGTLYTSTPESSMDSITPTRVGPAPDFDLNFEGYREAYLDYEYSYSESAFVPVAESISYDGVNTALCYMHYPRNAGSSFFTAGKDGCMFYQGWPLAFDEFEHYVPGFETILKITKGEGTLNKTPQWSVGGYMPHQLTNGGWGISALFHPQKTIEELIEDAGASEVGGSFSPWPASTCHAGTTQYWQLVNKYEAGEAQSFILTGSPHGYPNVWGVKMAPFFAEAWSELAFTVDSPQVVKDYQVSSAVPERWTRKVQVTDSYSITRGEHNYATGVYATGVTWGISELDAEYEHNTIKEKNCTSETVSYTPVPFTRQNIDAASPIISASSDAWWTSTPRTNYRLIDHHVFWDSGPAYRYPELFQKNTWGSIRYHDDDGDLAIAIIQDSWIETTIRTGWSVDESPESDGQPDREYNTIGGGPGTSFPVLGNQTVIWRTYPEDDPSNAGLPYAIINPAEEVRDKHYMRVLFGGASGSEIDGRRIFGASDLYDTPAYCGCMIVQPSERYDEPCCPPKEKVRAIYFSAVYPTSDHEPRELQEGDEGYHVGKAYRGKAGVVSHYKLHAVDAAGVELWTLEAYPGSAAWGLPFGIQSTDRHILIANFPMCDTRIATRDPDDNHYVPGNSLGFDWAISHDGEIKWPIRTEVHPYYTRATERHLPVALPSVSFDCIKNSTLLPKTPIRRQWLTTNEVWHTFFRYELRDAVGSLVSDMPFWEAINDGENGGDPEDPTVSYSGDKVTALKTGFVGFVGFPLYWSRRNSYKLEIIGKAAELSTVKFFWPAVYAPEVDPKHVEIWFDFAELDSLWAGDDTVLFDWSSEWVDEDEEIIKYTVQFGQELDETTGVFFLQVVDEPEADTYSLATGQGVYVHSVAIYKVCDDCDCDPETQLWPTPLGASLADHGEAM